MTLGKAAAVSVVLFVIVFELVITADQKKGKPQWQQINAFWAVSAFIWDWRYF